MVVINSIMVVIHQNLIIKALHAYCNMVYTEVVIAVDWSSICFAGYLATLEVVLGIVCLVGELLVCHRSCGRMQQHCPPEVMNTHRCNGNYKHIYHNAWLEFVENYGSTEGADLGFWVPSAELL
ncbi:hypothetical protein PIB30_091762 [Stylosanthes scabra]|uniref:Uncharacterized protein n=1 Tax=Stylosanthes scabra TaxID=79078 RepID=A0ABU6UU43_9FABA|nr:hypothetical protein [Stylosanthes scabra]